MIRWPELPDLEEHCLDVMCQVRHERLGARARGGRGGAMLARSWRALVAAAGILRGRRAAPPAVAQPRLTTGGR